MKKKKKKKTLVGQAEILTNFDRRFHSKRNEKEKTPFFFIIF